jgi:hypothetical protein
MSIVITEIIGPYRDTPIHDCTLAVSTSGLTVNVAQGTFSIESTEYTLEAQEVTVTPDPAEDVWVDGILAKNIGTGEAALLVDEMVIGDPSYDFSGSYELLHRLFSFLLPAGATTLDDVVIRVRHITPQDLAQE